MAMDHGWSVLVNSCVKMPVNPQTGQPATLNERSSYKEGKLSNETKDESLEKSKNDVSKECMADLINLSGEAFYERLQELKKEQNKTLEIIERLYEEKTRERHSTLQDAPSPTKNHSGGGDGLDNAIAVSTLQISAAQEFKENDTNLTSSPIKKATKDVTLKEFCPHLSSTTRDLWESPIRNKNAFTDSIENLSYVDSENDLEENQERKTKSAMAYVDQLWENFSINNYAPRVKRSSLPGTPLSLRKNKCEQGLKVTIPRPFNMTIRESIKPKKKTVTQIEAEHSALDKKLSEVSEIGKKFKANPVPAHTFLPLYKNIVAKEEERRYQFKEKRKALLEAESKPFNFEQRLKGANHHRTHSLPEEFTTTFKARPIPKYINSTDNQELIKEEEFYRKINNEIRQQKLLKTSALPPNMQNSPSKKHHHKHYYEKSKLFSPEIHRNVPNFDAIHKRLLQEQGKMKGHKESTVCKPFKLYTSQLNSKTKKKKDSLEKPKDKNIERKKQSNLTGEEAPQARMTAAAQMRQIATKKFLENMLQKELEVLEKNRQRKLKEFRLKPHISARAHALNPSRAVEEDVKDRLKQFKQAEQVRLREYQKELNDMLDRVEQRPFLFERLSVNNAKKMAENHFTNTLRKAGIDVDEFLKTNQELFSDQSSVSSECSRDDSRSEATNSHQDNVSQEEVSEQESEGRGEDNSEQGSEEFDFRRIYIDKSSDEENDNESTSSHDS